MPLCSRCEARLVSLLLQVTMTRMQVQERELLSSALHACFETHEKPLYTIIPKTVPLTLASISETLRCRKRVAVMKAVGANEEEVRVRQCVEYVRLETAHTSRGEKSWYSSIYTKCCLRIPQLFGNILCLCLAWSIDNRQKGKDTALFSLVPGFDNVAGQAYDLGDV